VFRGLPVRGVPATPQDNTLQVGEKTELARIQAIFNSALGHMVGYEAEGGGRLFQDMVPSKPMEFTQTSQSSRVELESHVEQAFSPLRPDFVSLGCLRGDPYAATYTFTATDLLERISPAEEAMLRKPLWTLEIDESFRVDNR
jgi:L-asparagine oxygenase